MTNHLTVNIKRLDVGFRFIGQTDYLVIRKPISSLDLILLQKVNNITTSKTCATYCHINCLNILQLRLTFFKIFFTGVLKQKHDLRFDPDLGI